MHYVIGDIHGCYQDMIALLNKIESQDQDAQIIFVGDFIDRGPDVDKVLDWCLENITLDGKYKAVRGNHEQICLLYTSPSPRDYIRRQIQGGPRKSRADGT